MAEKQEISARRSVHPLATDGRQYRQKSLPRPLSGIDRNPRSEQGRRPPCARARTLSSGSAARIHQQPQGCRERERRRTSQARHQESDGRHGKCRMPVFGRIFPHALSAERENPQEIYFAQRTLSGGIPGHLRKTTPARTAGTGLISGHLLPTAFEIAERSGRQMHVRKTEIALPGLPPAFRGVPHALFHQQHPHCRSGR